MLDFCCSNIGGIFLPPKSKRPPAPKGHILGTRDLLGVINIMDKRLLCLTSLGMWNMSCPARKIAMLTVLTDQLSSNNEHSNTVAQTKGLSLDSEVLGGISGGGRFDLYQCPG